jgi:site-specific DNA recombinase
MRAVVYTRQSFDRTGEGAAVARQLEDCLQLAELRGWTIVEQHSDNDISAAGKKKRPGFEAVLSAIAEDRATVVIAWALDRLSRNRADELRLVELCEAKAATIALVRGTDLDMSTPAGILVADVMGATARHEIKQKSDRQKRAQQQAAEQGRPAGGRRAFGYGRDGVTVVEAEAQHVREAFADVMHGASLKSIARRWNDAGAFTTAGNLWTHGTVRGVLKNPRYAGLRTYRGEVVGPAVWPALIDADTFEAVRAILSVPERRTTLTTARKYLLPGLVLCWRCRSDCMTGHTRHGKRVYVCRANKCISRKADPVDQYVEAVVVERLSRPDAADLLSADDRDNVRELQGRAAGIRERLDDLATGLEEGVLTLPAVRKSSERLRTELAAVEAEMAAAVHTDALGPLVAAQDVAEVWSRLDVQQRRQVVDALMTVTLLKPENGRRDFDPETVKIEWRGAP